MSLTKKQILEPELERQNYEFRLEEMVDVEYLHTYGEITHRGKETILPFGEGTRASKGISKTNERKLK